VVLPIEMSTCELNVDIDGGGSHVVRIPIAHRETTSNRAHVSRGVAAAAQQCLTACTRARAVCTSDSLGGAVDVEGAFIGGTAAQRQAVRCKGSNTVAATTASPHARSYPGARVPSPSPCCEK